MTSRVSATACLKRTGRAGSFLRAAGTGARRRQEDHGVREQLAVGIRRRRWRASTSLALVLSILTLGLVSGQHSHSETAESSAACVVCVSGHHAPISSIAPAVLHFAPIDNAREGVRYAVDATRSPLRGESPARAPPARRLVG